MQLFDSGSALVNPPIYRRSNGQSTSDDRANARQEPCKGLGSLFSIDDFHRRYVVAKEYTWNAAPSTPLTIHRLISQTGGHVSPCVQPFLVALLRVTSST